MATSPRSWFCIAFSVLEPEYLSRAAGAQVEPASLSSRLEWHLKPSMAYDKSPADAENASLGINPDPRRS